MTAVVGEGFQLDGILAANGQLSVPRATHTLTFPEAPGVGFPRYLRAPDDASILYSLKVRTVDGVSTSASGTYLLTATKVSDGGSSVNVIDGTSVNLEILSDQTDTDVLLDPSGGALSFADGDYLKVTVTSNNADLTGGNGILVSASWEPALGGYDPLLDPPIVEALTNPQLLGCWMVPEDITSIADGDDAMIEVSGIDPTNVIEAIFGDTPSKTWTVDTGDAPASYGALSRGGIVIPAATRLSGDYAETISSISRAASGMVVFRMPTAPGSGEYDTVVNMSRSTGSYGVGVSDAIAWIQAGAGISYGNHTDTTNWVTFAWRRVADPPNSNRAMWAYVSEVGGTWKGLGSGVDNNTMIHGMDGYYSIGRWLSYGTRDIDLRIAGIFLFDDLLTEAKLQALHESIPT
jgi:hypothetical protein